jgi:ssDNA-binding Zn-finger/Zn-ribbon topoisomerase 1
MFFSPKSWLAAVLSLPKESISASIDSTALLLLDSISISRFSIVMVVSSLLLKSAVFGGIIPKKERVDMALMSCSECGKEISDTVDACPYCGYKMVSGHQKTEAHKTTPIGNSKRKVITGVVYALISALFIVFIVLSISNQNNELQYIPYVMGRMWFIWCIGVLASAYYAVVNFVGWVEVRCPYCEKDEWIKRNAQNLKCRYCGNRSVRKGNILESVN